MRHALGALGVLAATVLLLVSGAMNWRFGYSLGHSEVDSQLLGLASAAADGLKALIPFFLFAALRNKAWSQALAATLLWTVCVTYSFTSALGFSALNRADTAGSRIVQASAYSDLKTEIDTARERLGWVPQHRPALTIAQEIDGQKNDRKWALTSGCVNATRNSQVTFCKAFHQSGAELAAAQEAEKLQGRIDELRLKLTVASSAVALASADPQAETMSRLLGQNMDLVKTGLTLMVAILVELGSALGYFVVFSAWKQAEPNTRSETVASPVVVTRPRVNAVQVAAAAPIAAPIANDNRQAPALVAPDSDLQRFHKERVSSSDGSSLTATTLYDDYMDWCNETNKEPMPLPSFSRQFGDLGVHKAKIAGRIRYLGIKLNSGKSDEEVTGVSQTQSITTKPGEALAA